ncbi:hypothetical protein [Zoogloea sp.]|nr:hypothetical protein [Zoogloea sp.]MBN8283042.1 hypothetical protein [Zoogloea sp.]
MSPLPILALILTVSLALAVAHRLAAARQQRARLRKQPLSSTRAKH